MGREQVTTRVAEEKKEEWREYAKDTHGSLTALIEQAVDAYIEANGELSVDSDDGGASASADVVTEVAEAIDRLENTVSDMDRRLETVRESVQSEEAYSFEAAIRETLGKRPKDAPPENAPDFGLTVREIAARLDARESDVSDALRDLEQSGEVRSLGGGPENENYYFQRRGE